MFSRLTALLVWAVVLVIFPYGAVYAQSASKPLETSTRNAPAPNIEDAYRVGPGDKLHITVFGEQDLSGDFEIDGTGTLSFPLIGSVKVGGMTIRGIESALAGKLSPNYLKNPRITVEVLNYRPFYILGEVKNPGSYPFVSGMTVLNAVALAGGFTPRANEGRLLIIRAGDPQRKEQKAAVNAPVYPGDIVRVPERFF